MKIIDPNIGYVFGYKSKINEEGILVTFLGDLIKILFRFDNIQNIYTEHYKGGRVSYDIIRWGKCPPGTEALRIVLKKGIYKNHLIVFTDLTSTTGILKEHGINIS